ncbi:MAG TPA: CDP-diacylglycerol diphosphatase, partial [Candidatus Methylomirabilis sp.]|nr:CDP-diacylglycerol diphosphatase [Candidatus Methylomirabilis sp.]
RFAWEAARTRIPEEAEIALAVNPPSERTQDQLHVHLVRLLPGARARVDALRPRPVEHLEEVWSAAAQHASSRGLAAYGVIVVRGAGEEWVVAADGGSPEARFTIALCHRPGSSATGWLRPIGDPVHGLSALTAQDSWRTMTIAADGCDP